ncbi:MAG: ATP synthase F0 subunit B [Aquificaceae bacterium]|nr:ATP synthase F0 subunit B [Aquificaceae bacterium]MCX8076866.1 ATP synthase F0 subunit B [Aquificaceae bacterium]MDW8095632.1 ATP synthase F0 subunit B [Aquificaceae bacterium]MDW8433685.1 ATP synthase F0 subunit B [Aquificaceae bacterium]
MDIQQAMYPNATLFIQAVLFLVFVALVRSLLIKPYSQVIEERESIAQRNMEEALKLREEAQKYVEEANAILEKGRKDSHNIVEEARRNAEKIRVEILTKVESETQEEILKAVEEIRKSLEEEKRKMEERVREVAELIATKVVEEAA